MLTIHPSLVPRLRILSAVLAPPSPPPPPTRESPSLAAGVSKLLELYVSLCESCDHRPEDGDSKYLWNVGRYLPDYTTQHPGRQLFFSSVDFLISPVFTEENKLLIGFIVRSHAVFRLLILWQF